MANLYEIAGFNVGWAPKFGVMKRIRKNDKITRFEVNLAHVPKSDMVDYGFKVDSNKGRHVRGAIWICNDGWSLANTPDYKSRESYNTDDFAIQYNKNTFTWTNCAFTFDCDPIYADKVILGLYTDNMDEDNTRETSICYQKSYGTTLYYMRDLFAYTPEWQLQNSNGINIQNIEIVPYYELDPEEPQGNKPTLSISNIKYRTLSLYDQPQQEGNALPKANLDKLKITNGGGTVSMNSNNNTQWNTTQSGHRFSSTQGFDFAEGCLKDVTLFDAGTGANITATNSTNWNDPAHPYWCHSRSRILFTFEPWTKASCRLKYKVTGAGETSSKSTSTFVENSSYASTLLICPRDEGIDDNSAWEIEFVRCSYDGRGNVMAESTPIVLYFNTFVEPEVKIAHPKPLRNKIDIENNKWSDEEYNYVLWANDVNNDGTMNETGAESRSVQDQICDALNMLLTKDGGDNSEFPMFTRVYIEEYEATYKQTSPNHYELSSPTNDDIYKKSSNLKRLANWTGIFLDDGNLIQLSGMKTDGFTWDKIWEEEPGNWNAEYASSFPLPAFNYQYETQKTNETTGKLETEIHTVNITRPPYHSCWVVSDVNELGESFDSIYSSTIPQCVVIDKDGNKTYKDTPGFYIDSDIMYNSGYAIDKRMVFRAGRKYLIRVRRFHSAVAGAINATEFMKSPYVYMGFPQGGNYNYQNDYYSATPDKNNTGDFYHNSYKFPEFGSDSSKDITKWLLANNQGKYLIDDANSIRWVGPFDGASTSASINKEEINEVYPGYSKVDYVVLDCLNVIYTARDIVSARPSTAEINANGWITFAYRHLNKNRDAIDSTCYDSSIQNKLSGIIQSDGTPKANNASGHGIGQTWGGNDNTYTRIYKMYLYMIKYILKMMPQWEHDPDPENNTIDAGIYEGLNLGYTRDDICGWTVDRRKFQIYIDKEFYNVPEQNRICTESGIAFEQGPWYVHDDFNIMLSDGSYVPVPEADPVNDPENFRKYYVDTWNHIVIYEDTEYSTDNSVFKSDCLMGFMKEMANPAQSTVTTGPNGLQIFHNVVPNPEGSSDDYDNNYPLFGNTYNWVPIINATKLNGNVNLPITFKTTANNVNFKDIGEGYQSEYTPDTNHGINDVNTDTSNLSNKTWNFPENAKPIEEFTAYRTNPDASANGKRFINLCSTRGSTKLNSLTTSWYMTYGTREDKDKNTGKNEGVQYFNADGVQTSTGELYKRIPLSQDCENGIPTANRLASPISKIKYPLVRTTHMLFFKTYTFGKLMYRLVYGGTLSHLEREYDEEGNIISETCVKGPTVDPIYGEMTIDNKELTQEQLAEKYAKSTLYSIGKHVLLKEEPQEFHQVIEVYGEDNGGAGRLLSADNDTTAWYDASGNAHSINSTSNPKLDGGIEIPIRVRYTPLIQPIVTTDEIILDELAENTTYLNTNIISVATAYDNCQDKNKITREYESANVADNLKYKEFFSINISYGMLNSLRGRYVTFGVNDDWLNKYTYHSLQQNTRFIKAESGKTLKNQNKVVTPLSDSQTSTDIYPAVGVCNCFTILLVPHGILDENGNPYDYTGQVSNWYKDRANYEDLAVKSGSTAKTVIVADLACDENRSLVYKDGETNPFYTNPLKNEHTEEYTNEEIDNQFRTIYSCKFNYYNLLHENTLNEESGWKEGSENLTRKNKLIPNTWYDLVIIPVYSNHAKNASFCHYQDGAGYLTNSDESGTQYKYGAQNENGTPIPDGPADGSPQTDEEKYIDYYGSTPLVIRKFLKIDGEKNLVASNMALDENGDIDNCHIPDGGWPPDPDPEENPDLYYNTLPAIVYPNINNYRFSSDDMGYIKECPGFWLNNTFRVIIRGPHFRSQAEIDANPSGIDSEQSIESATDNKLSGLEGSRNFKPSDFQIHIGKYTDIDEETGYAFNSKEFEQELNKHSNDVDWLNKRQIYSMRYNSEAFSKCTPANKKDPEEDRDVVLGGDLSYDGPRYSDRFFEFNPNIVGATTPYPEGYYIQIRWLNNEYSNTTSSNGWSIWYGGLLKDNIPDSKLSYCVPVRNFNDIFTSFRAFIKESYSGSAITTKAEDISESGTSEEKILDIIGQGTESPRTAEGEYPNSGILYSPGNASNTPIVPSEKVEAVVADVDSNNNLTTTITNTDLPYFSQIWGESKGTSQDATKYKHRFPIPSEIDDKHKRYWEMTYVDYIIRNMVKLYYSDFPGAYISREGAPTAADFGWTQTLANAYSEASWTPGVVNTGNVQKGNNYKITNPQKTPANRNRYFRKPIMKEDFDQLTDTLKRLVSFIRDERFTGKHTKENDPKGADGRSDGTGVLMIDPDSLEFDKQIRGVVGSEDVMKTDQGDWSYPIDTNYIRILMDNIINKIIFYLD